MIDIDLKPCPFCGGEADISHDHTVEENHAYGCRICGIWFDSFNSDEAAEAWNTRAAMTPTPQEAAKTWATEILRRAEAERNRRYVQYAEAGDKDATRYMNDNYASTLLREIRAISEDSQCPQH